MKTKLFALAALTLASSSAMAFTAPTGTANFSAETVVPPTCVVTAAPDNAPEIMFGTEASTEKANFTVVSNVKGQVKYTVSAENTGLVLVSTGAAPAFNDKAAGISFVNDADTVFSTSNSQLVDLDKGAVTFGIGLDTDLGSESFIATDSALTTATVTVTCPDAV